MRPRYTRFQSLRVDVEIGDSKPFIAQHPFPCYTDVMPRNARLVLPGVLHHLTRRGNDRRAVLPRDADYRQYLEFLREYTGNYRHAAGRPGRASPRPRQSTGGAGRQIFFRNFCVDPVATTAA